MNNKLHLSDFGTSARGADDLRIAYSANPIRSTEELARSLGLKSSLLTSCASKADSQYRCAGTKLKSDGKPRHLWDAAPPLKLIHQRIKEKLLTRVVFPRYIQGGVRGCSQMSNARIHAQARVLISDDIQSFFPTISAIQVFRIWRHVFRFSRQVSNLLTTLTTRDGALPQGAITSPALANMVLWQVEPQLVTQLNRLGFRYSRFVDDVCVSSRRSHPLHVIKRVSRAVHAVLLGQGFAPKLEKHELAWRGRRMFVTKINVDNKLSFPRERIRSIKSDVVQLALLHESGSNDKCEALSRSLLSRAGIAKRFHPRLARNVRSQVLSLRKNS